MAAQGESGEERESEPCQQGGTGLSGGRPGLRRRQRRDLEAPGTQLRYHSPHSSFSFSFSFRMAERRRNALHSLGM